MYFIPITFKNLIFLKDHLRKQYQDYPDEKLIHILSEDNNAYSEDAKAIAEEILLDRGYDIEHREALEQDPAAALDEMERPDGLIQQDILVRESEHGVTGRINSLIDNIEQQEERLQRDWSTELQALSDEALIGQYTEILTPFTENTDSKLKDLSPIADMELRTIIAEVSSRTLNLPAILAATHKKTKDSLNKTTLKEGRKKQNLNVPLGLVLILFPVLVFAAGEYHRLLLVPLIIGSQRFYVGAQAMSQARAKLL